MLRVLMLVLSAVFLTMYVMEGDSIGWAAWWGVLTGYWMGALIWGDD
jgi:hypothetical protein